MATVDKNLNSGIKPIDLQPAIVFSQRKAMPSLVSSERSPRLLLDKHL